MTDSLADRLAAAMAAEGAAVLFGLPGGGPNLDVLGAAERHGLRFVLAHAETPAAIMAGTYGLLTGAPTPPPANLVEKCRQSRLFSTKFGPAWGRRRPGLPGADHVPGRGGGAHRGPGQRRAVHQRGARSAGAGGPA